MTKFSPQTQTDGSQAAAELSRIYICIALQEVPLIARLRGASQALPQLKQRSEYHVTLNFIGAVTPAQLIALWQGSQRIARQQAPFRLTLGRPGYFSRVVWYGLQPSQTLSQLQSKLEALITSLGLPVAHSAYKPHITLGRHIKAAEAVDRVPQVQASWLVKTLEIRQAANPPRCWYQLELKWFI